MDAGTKAGQSLPSEKDHKSYSNKKGIGFGAFGGFIAAVVFAGIILWMPLVLGFPVGTFLRAIGLFIMNPMSTNDPVVIPLTGFVIILVKGIVVGIIFGIITSKVNRLHTSSKKKGIGLGLVAGIIAYLVLFVPAILTLFPELLSKALETYPQTQLSINGLSDYNTSIKSNSSMYVYNTLGLGIIAYLIYGFIMGGIVTLGYSVYHFDLEKLMEGRATQAS
jgi:hypothetical protein